MASSFINRPYMKYGFLEAPFNVHDFQSFWMDEIYGAWLERCGLK